MSVLQLWQPAQADPQVPVNENFEALEHMAVYGKDATSTAALNWGYLGGRWAGFSIAAGTLALTASTINYVTVNRSTGAISAAATDTAWTNVIGHARVYKLTAGAASVTAVEDWRIGTGGVHGITVAAGDLGTPLSGLDTGVSPAPIVAADTVLQAFGKLQSQINNGGGGSGGGSGLWNKAINGDCRVAKAGNTALPLGTLTYGGCDMFWGLLQGFTSVSGATLLQAAMEGAACRLGQWIQSITTTGSGTVTFGHRVESNNSGDLNGKKCTVSGVLYQDTGADISVTLQASTPMSKDAFTAMAAIANTTVSIPSGAVTPFSFTFDVGTIAGTSSGEYGLQFTAAFPAGAMTGKRFGLGSLQIIEGAQAAPFSSRLYSVEELLCARYLPVIKAQYASDPISQSWATGTTDAFCEVAFLVSSRVPPTGLIVSAPSDFKIFSPAGIGLTLTGLTLNVASSRMARLFANVSGGLTQGAAGSFAMNTVNGSLLFTGCRL